MSARAKNKFCRNCKFKTSVRGLYTDYSACKLTGQPIKNRNKRCGCISLYRANTKQFRFDLLLHNVCDWSGVHACNDNYCGYEQGGRANK